MITIAGIILPLLCAILFGTHTSNAKRVNYLVISILALIQTCLVLIDMYTLESPLE